MIIRNAAFWTVWRRLKDFSLKFGAQIGAAKFKRGLTMHLKVIRSVSFEAPQVEPATAFIKARPRRPLAAAFWAWAEKENLVSNLIPRISGVLFNFNCETSSGGGRPVARVILGSRLT